MATTLGHMSITNKAATSLKAEAVGYFLDAACAELCRF